MASLGEWEAEEGGSRIPVWFGVHIFFRTTVGQARQRGVQELEGAQVLWYINFERFDFETPTKNHW